ncbi:MAG: MoxR family ATPase [Gammaproteobacteria bacterium]|jgi:MoxR-like ATPase|nr:MoxR family ATPase [Gammaproteobacteria bacterium]
MNHSESYRQPEYPRIRADRLHGREGHVYQADPGLLAAANAALALEMPLLLTGEAGCGKTDFAYAVASALARDREVEASRSGLLECYVRSDSRAQDLLYHYDALSRFGDAHHGGEAGRLRAEEVRNYIELRDLGRALMSSSLRVVLIDEIDKAPRDLPNDLLRELDQGHFEIPEIPAADYLEGVSAASGDQGQAIDPERPLTYRNQMRRPEGARKPMVIITSNVERQLPDPFLRRCVFFHIPFPDKAELRAILADRFPGAPALDHAVDIFKTLRDVPNLTKRPTTSELINWVQTLNRVFREDAVDKAFAGFPTGDAVADRPAELSWAVLPGLGCLVKLREDLDRLGVAARHGA